MAPPYAGECYAPVPHLGGEDDSATPSPAPSAAPSPSPPPVDHSVRQQHPPLDSIPETPSSLQSPPDLPVVSGSMWQACKPTPAIADSGDKDEDVEEAVNFVFAHSELDDDEKCALFVSKAEPLTYEEAMCCPDADKWCKAMDEELAGHRPNGRWEVNGTSPGQRLKCKADGSIEHYKASSCCSSDASGSVKWPAPYCIMFWPGPMP